MPTKKKPKTEKPAPEVKPVAPEPKGDGLTPGWYQLSLKPQQGVRRYCTLVGQWVGTAVDGKPMHPAVELNEGKIKLLTGPNEPFVLTPVDPPEDLPPHLRGFSQ